MERMRPADNSFASGGVQLHLPLATLWELGVRFHPLPCVPISRMHLNMCLMLMEAIIFASSNSHGRKLPLHRSFNHTYYIHTVCM